MKDKRDIVFLTQKDIVIMKKKRKRNRFAVKLSSSRALAKSRNYIPCIATTAEAQEMFHGKCDICGIGELKLGCSLYLDHCHSTGRLRGFLCRPCNSAIGLLKDSPELLNKAIKYLTKPSRS